MVKTKTMSTLINSFLSLISPFLNRYIDTGDRNFDIAISGFFTLLISTFVMYLMNKLSDDNFKNKILYHFWYRQKDPIDFGSDHYFINLTNDNIISEYLNIDQSKFIGNLLKENKYNKKFAIEIGNVRGYSFIPFYYDGTCMILIQSSNMDILTYILDKNNRISSKDKFLKWLNNSMPNNSFTSKYKIIKGLDNDRKLSILGNININKTFDTLYYDQKSEVLEAITKFRDNKLYPKTISMDNKLGILLYGPPGTGKTGTISACANFLNRDVIIIDFTIIKTCQQLDDILKPAEYNRNIYVFDEFDCILDVLVGNDKKDNIIDKEPEQDWSKIFMVAEGEERKQILEMMKDGKGKLKNKDQPINLGYLLRKLDGLEDSSGRFIIATTNNPQNINPALLRPGRFDIKLCLGNCTTQMYSDILGNFFEVEQNERKIIINAGLKAGRWSPLQVINTALTQKTLRNTLNYLKNN